MCNLFGTSWITVLLHNIHMKIPPSPPGFGLQPCFPHHLLYYSRPNPKPRPPWPTELRSRYSSKKLLKQLLNTKVKDVKVIRQNCKDISFDTKIFLLKNKIVSNFFRLYPFTLSKTWLQNEMDITLHPTDIGNPNIPSLLQKHSWICDHQLIKVSSQSDEWFRTLKGHAHTHLNTYNIW